MTFTVGQRVRVRRPDSRTQVRTGDFGSIVSTSYNSRGETYRVRLERAIDRTPRQTPEAGDYTFEPAQLDAAAARGPRDFIVGDRVALRNGVISLRANDVTEPAGTLGVIERLGRDWASSGSPAAVTVRLDSGRMRSVYLDQIVRTDAPVTAADPERNPTVAVGDRVTCVRADNVRAATGQSGAVTRVSDTYIEVRFDRDIAHDYSSTSRVWNVSEWTREAAAREFRVGDRVRLRDGARTLSQTYITEPAGTEGEITTVYGSGSWSVRTASTNWSVYTDQMELIETPDAVAATPEPQVGDRVRLRDGAVTLRAHGISVDPGAEGEIVQVRGETVSPGRYYQVRVSGLTWSCHRDQVEPLETPAPAEIQWVTATADNAVAGARIRYRASNSPRYVDRGDVGVIVHVSQTTAYNGIKIFMDTPREYARSVTRDGYTFHWGVALRDIEVAAPDTAPAPVAAPAEAAVETWTRLDRSANNTATRQANVGRRVRYTGDGGSWAGLTDGDLGTIVDCSGATYYMRMDDPRRQTLTGTGETAYHWQSTGSDWEIQVTTPAPAAEIYTVTHNGVASTWTVGARLEFTDESNRESYRDPVVTTSAAYHRQERSGTALAEAVPDWYDRYVFFEYTPRSGGSRRITGLLPQRCRQVEAAATPTTANGEVTFTDAQKRAIAQMARRYADRHGYGAMVDGILGELNAEDPALNRRRVRLTIAVDVEVEGVDGYSLPANDADLRAMIRNQNGNQIIDAALNRRLRRVGDATVGDRGITYRD